MTRTLDCDALVAELERMLTDISTRDAQFRVNIELNGQLSDARSRIAKLEEALMAIADMHCALQDCSKLAQEVLDADR